MLTWRVNRAQVDPRVADAVDALLGADPATWMVTGGLRTLDEQAADYAKGRDANGVVIDKNAVVTNAKPGQSAHNFGLAVDVTLIEGTKDSWDYQHDPSWQRMISAVRATANLHSGADFPGLKDYPHIELYHWFQHTVDSAPGAVTS